MKIKSNAGRIRSLRILLPACWLLLAMPIAPGLLEEAEAQHLFAKRQQGRVFMFADTQAWDVGDLITVLVRESTDVENNDSRAMSRQSKAGGGFNLSTAFTGDLGNLAGTANYSSDMETNNAFDGSSSYSIDRVFTDRITVTVRRVLPNGNMVIAGSRRQRVSGEYRTLKISGVIRPWDIRADNTITSQHVGNLRMCYAGDGDESTFTNQGWLGQRLNRWLPF